jgi:sugar/nucleoside kinase (ribokinase family)
MHTQYLILHDCSQRQQIKHPIEIIIDTIGVGDVFAEAHSTLLSQPKQAVDLSVFVAASQEDDVLRVFEFEREKQADGL